MGNIRERKVLHVPYMSVNHQVFFSVLYTHCLNCTVGEFGKFTILEYLAKTVWQINRSAYRLLLVKTYLNAFS